MNISRKGSHLIIKIDTAREGWQLANLLFWPGSVSDEIMLAVRPYDIANEAANIASDIETAEYDDIRSG